jgi:predicted dehydrogenase
VDLDRERINLSVSFGASCGVHPDDGDNIAQVARLTGGGGADGVIITAASPSNAIISAGFRMCRKKARVVLVGDVGLDLQRADFYEKELDFLISTSYGPGRYDTKYEDDGLDYPLGYVRWTENRNMTEYLRLVADKTIDVQPMISLVRPIEEATEVFRRLSLSEVKPLMALLTYAHKPQSKTGRVELPILARKGNRDSLQVAVIGAGNFAKGMHLPNLLELKKHYQLRAIVSRSGHNAMSSGKRFGAEYCSTDYREVLYDDQVDVVIIATRHDKHASIALEALKAGKHVLVEKPLALDEQELIDIEEFFAKGPDPKPLLLTGFNRRFSPCAARILSFLSKRTNPMIINYQMNAGYIPLDHWVHSQEGGGRNRGEACHIYDLFTFLTGAQVSKVQATKISPRTDYYSAADNFVATITFDDGSVATLTYTALGSSDYPKEIMEIFVDGKVISLEDYRNLTITGGVFKPIKNRVAQKGQKEEIIAFARAVKGGGGWPIPLWQQLQATRISFEVDRQLLT